MHFPLPFLAMLLASLLLDAAVRPRTGGIRHWQGALVHVLAMTMVFGVFLAGSGNFAVAATLATALMALFTVASNAKKRMLGEPLVFSDLALLVAIVRHPRFYFTALSARQRMMMVGGAAFALVVLVRLFSLRIAPHLVGLGLVLAMVVAITLLLRSRRFETIARTPDLEADVTRYGLVATLLLYARRWRHTPDPQPCVAPEIDGAAPAIIVVVQCESFADPVEIGGGRNLALPGLAAARAVAWQYGDLHVSGFGAYTMRTEYGVLFGRGEAELGFRRYDPFLSAHGEATYALSAKLRDAGYHCSFVHPHDLRFYSRDRLMPAIGFDRLIGEDAFAPRSPGAGRYVEDRMLGAALGDLVDQATGPGLIYAVTMENHGPWDSAHATDARGRLDAYLRHLHSSDAMLTGLIDRLARAGRAALLVFFGDHRPSILGVTAPGDARHTPYVMIRFDSDGMMRRDGPGRADLSPADLHHAILANLR